MAVMEDGDFEIQGVLLKGTPDFPIYVQEFDPGSTDHQDQDALNPLDDTILMGRDRIIPPVWAFQLGMGDFTKGPALEALGQLMRVWRMPQTEPGVYIPLKYKIGGRVRQVFGRPRPFTFNPEMLVNVGYAVASAGFHTNDPLHYDTTEKSTNVTMVNRSQGGGFRVPFTAPILTNAGSTRAGFVTNAGSAPAPFIARVNGPVVNPVVEGTGWKLALERNILEGDWVEVNTRDRTVRDRSGANLRGALTRDSKLLSAKLKPGRDEITFSGVDPTGLSSVRVSWFDAYYEH